MLTNPASENSQHRQQAHNFENNYKLLEKVGSDPGEFKKKRHFYKKNFIFYWKTQNY